MFIALFFSLFALIILIRLRVELGLALLASTLLLGVLNGFGLRGLFQVFFHAFWQETTFSLIATLFVIIALENVLRRQGYLDRLLTALRVLFRDPRTTMALCPAFLGLLPSVGGAIFSAPMVEEVAADSSLAAEEKSFINYWFRHVWEYSLPLYPGVILTAKILEIPVARLAWRQFPLTVLAAVLGWLFAFPRGKIERSSFIEGRPEERRRAWRDLAIGAAPVLTVLFVVLGTGLEVWPVVLITVALLMAFHRYRLSQIGEVLRAVFSFRQFLLVVGIMAFREMLEATGTIESLPRLFLSLGVPPFLLVVLLPLVLAPIIGLSQGFVGACFPLLIRIIGLGQKVKIGLASLAYCAGFTGLMLSPLHLCFALTVQFFGADLGRVWRRVLLPMAVVFSIAVIYNLILP
ncbi:MAG: DUF401 family protein [Bacillota bacterium]